MKSTQEIFPNFSDRLIEYYDRQLLREDGKGYVDLAGLHGSVHHAGIDIPILQNRDIKAEREVTLDFLYNLLLKDKIKVGKYVSGPGIAQEYTGTPDEIIEALRTEWNNTVEGVVNKNPLAFEMDIHITLKDNPWPVWR